MGDFSHEWLALREPADRQARDSRLLREAVAHLLHRRPIEVIDLGCGTGSTVRALSPLLPREQRWRLVDQAASLLDRALAQLPPTCDPAQAVGVVADLEGELERVLEEGAGLITLSAFLDLVSERWIERLVAAAGRQGAAVYAALNYDGRTACGPFDAMDAQVLEAFNTHQRRDKGLGAALGPRAGGVAAERFAAAGFRVLTARADWCVGQDMPELQRQLLSGWVTAAAETGQIDPNALADWHERRRADIERGQLQLTVGHVDLLAFPPQSAAAPPP